MYLVHLLFFIFAFCASETQTNHSRSSFVSSQGVYERHISYLSQYFDIES